MEYDLAGTIIGCAMKVHRALGPGFLESVYQRSLMIELRGIKLPAEELKSIKVYYADEVVGDFVADILVNDELIIENKAVNTLLRAHEVQLVNYLTATRTEVGLLLNFGADSLQYRKKFRTRRDPSPVVL